MRLRAVHAFTFRSLITAAGIAPVALACSGASSSSGSAADTTIVTKEIGPGGGVIEVEGAVVTFPKNAVAKDTTITIAAAQGGVPEGFVALSKRFKCEPSGTAFAQPVEMRMPFVDDGKGGTMFWSSGADPAFKDLGGRIEGNVMVATVKTFSEGFVGRKK